MIELLVWFVFTFAWAAYGTHVIREFIKHNWNILK